MAYEGLNLGTTVVASYTISDNIIDVSDAGEIRFDNLDQLSATTLKISAETANGINIHNNLTKLVRPGSLLKITDTKDPDQFEKYEVTSVTDFSTYIEYGVALYNGTGIQFPNKRRVALSLAGNVEPPAIYSTSSGLRANEQLQALPGFTPGKVLQVNSTGDGFILVASDKYDNFIFSESEDSNDTDVPANKLSWSDTLPIGNYEVLVNYELHNDSVAGKANAALSISGSLANEVILEPKDDDDWHSCTHYARIISPLGGPQTVILTYWNSGAGTTKIRRARLAVKSV